MSRVTPMQTAYNGGELSAFMLGRPDHEIWPVALAEMVGFAPRPQGPAEACPGFEYVATAPGPCRLIPFEPYTTQGYVIEASANLFRFYTNDVLLESGGSPVEVATPYSYAQVLELRWWRSNDVLFLFHPDVQTRQLVRTAADAFTLETVDFGNGPFGNRNADESLTLSASGTTGSVTVTASAALFAATDVGRAIEMEAHDLSNVPSWEPGLTTALGALMQWDGRVYQVVGGAGATLRTGTVAPIHVRGVEWDGKGSGTDYNSNTAGGVKLAYMHDMFGRLVITGYTSATEVSATVTRTLPLQLASSYTIGAYVPGWFTPDGSYSGGVAWTDPGTGTYTSGTWRWRLGAFSDTTGWPRCGAIDRQRLIVGKDDTIYGSVAGDLYDFDRLNEYGEVSVDQAFTEPLEDPNPIEWIEPGAELFVGSATKEYVLREASAASPFGPGNLKLVKQEEHGSADIPPVQLGGRPIFVQRQGRKVMHLTETTYSRYEAADLTRYADHIGNSAFVEFCWQKQPLQLLWAVRADGTLASADYVPDEQVLGWNRRPLAAGMSAKSICPITSPDGTTDQLWLAAEYGGDTFVMLQDAWRLAGEQADLPIMLDAALRYDGSSGPISTLSLPHLPDTEVEVVVNGAWLGSMTTDASGDIALASPATTAVAGLPFDAYLVFLPVEGGGDNGPAQAKMKRCNRVTFRLQNALGLSVTCQGQKVNDIGNVKPGDALDNAIAPITDDRTVDIVGTWDRAGQLRMDRYAPFPATLLAHMPTFEVSQR